GAPMAQPPDLENTATSTTTVSWTLRTTRLDGSALTPAVIGGVLIYFAEDQAALASMVSVVGDATSAVLTVDVTEETTIFFEASVVDAAGLESGRSNRASKTFTLELDSPPNPPVLEDITLDISCTTNFPEITCRFEVQ